MLIAELGQYFFGIAIFVTSMFLVMLVLVQRGRGGGLTGALGGPGGQSVFGTKAGDLFTRITVGVAAVWITLCAASVYFLKAPPLPSTGLSSSDPSFTDRSDDVAEPPAILKQSSPAAAESGMQTPAGDAVEAEFNSFPEDPATGLNAPASGDAAAPASDDADPAETDAGNPSGGPLPSEP